MARELTYVAGEHGLLAIGVLDDNKARLPTPARLSLLHCSIAIPSDLSLATTERPLPIAVAHAPTWQLSSCEAKSQRPALRMTTVGTVAMRAMQEPAET
jgi:hypothetical protein